MSPYRAWIAVMLAAAFLTAAGCLYSPSSTGTSPSAQSSIQATAAIPAVTAAAPGSAASDTSCPVGQTICPDGNCYDTRTDANNCGGCKEVCPSGDSCRSSACVTPTTTVSGTATTAITTNRVTAVPTVVRLTIPFSQITITPTPTPTVIGTVVVVHTVSCKGTTCS